MFIADGWKEYKVLDTSNGEKLENWAGYELVRPDPQVIWNTKRTLPGWRKPNAHYHRSSKGGGEWEFFDLPEQWEIHYELGTGTVAMANEIAPASIGTGTVAMANEDASIGTGTVANANETAPASCKTETAGDSDSCTTTLTFGLKPFSFKHTGLFPEQATNWEWFSRIIKDAIASGHTSSATGGNVGAKVLNLFAYTGGATLAAAASGASVTHVDASKGMVAWAKENAALSGLSDKPIRWLVDDCMKFVERELRRGNRYDAIIMDPPSYGRGPKGEIWKIEDSIFPLVTECAKLLSDRPLFFLINSYTTGLQPAVLSQMLTFAIKNGCECPALDGGMQTLPARGGCVSADEVGLPIDGGLVLPCGASGRWQA